MNRSERVQEILGLAVGLPAEECENLLERECAGDAALRAEVESLLRSHSQAGRFLAAPTVNEQGPQAVVTGNEAAREGRGTRIGPYKLLERIGEGGFGTVFMAEQEQPVRRKVALKIIKPGMDTGQVVARFEQERQALAMMDHSNIARVFDAGTTETGRPYFVMELVQGDPIIAYCDKNSLSIPERLELFAQVCAAVQHAHTKGIIHRDLKPSNILVSTQDGRPLAKVIDFGIAKATDARLTDKTLFTEHRVLLGTPQYMSPEQAEGSLDIDTRTDVYSLGVLLYELLTGSTPFSKDELRAAAYAEIQRIIREVDPPKPSTRLSRSSATLASVALQRRTQPAKLGAIVRGELDWVVMKALEKDRSRRYESARSLESDVRRYLSGEAVTAAPPGNAYLLRKFVRRHKGAVAAVGAVGLALLVGAAAFAWQARIARAERDRAIAAQQRESEQRQFAEKNRLEAVRQKSLAEANAAAEAKARKRSEAINDFVVTVLTSSDPKEGDKDTTILDSMGKALKDIGDGRFKDDPEIEAQLKATIGFILLNNGRASAGDALLAEALATCRAKLPPGDPQTVSVLDHIAVAHSDRGEFAEAQPLFAEVLTYLQKAHPGDHADVAKCMSDLGNTLVNLGQMSEAESWLVQALNMRKRLFKGDHRDIAHSLNGLSTLSRALGRKEETERLLSECVDMMRRLNPGDSYRLAIAIGNLAGARLALGRTKEADLLYVESLEMKKRIYGGDHPLVADAMSKLGLGRLSAGNAKEAEKLLRESVEMRQRMVKGDDPDLASDTNSLAIAILKQNRFADAEPLIAQSLEMERRLYKGDHQEIASSLVDLAFVQQALKRFDESRKNYEESIAMQRRLSPEGSSKFANVLWRLGKLHMAEDRPAEALPYLEEAVSMAARNMPANSPALATCQATLAQCKAALGK